VGFLLGKFKLDMLDEQLAAMALDLQQMKIYNTKLETKQSRLDIITVSDQQTIKSLLQSNKELQDELAFINNKLYFYEGVLAPENEITGVKVHSFEITKDKLTDRWNYELVLMQAQKGRRLLNGRFEIVISVFEGEELKQIALSELNETGSFDFKFKYFQTIQGSFSLPREMSVDEIILKLGVEGNRWHKAQNLEKRYDWRVLTTKDTGDSSEFELNSASE